MQGNPIAKAKTVGIMVLFLIVLICFANYVKAQPGLTTMKAIVILAIVFIFIPISIRKGLIYATQGWAEEQPSGREAMAKDPRSPILFLRPFETDHTSHISLLSLVSPNAPYEFQLRCVFSSYGPLVAFECPDATLPPDGASRLYAGDAWKEEVAELMQQASLNVFWIGEGKSGFKQELARGLRILAPERIMLVFPRCPWYRGGRKAREQRYQRVRGLAQGNGSVQLPHSLGRGIVVCFDRCGKPLVFRSSLRLMRSPECWSVSKAMKALSAQGWPYYGEGE